MPFEFTQSVICRTPLVWISCVRRMNRRMTRMTRLLLLAASLGLAVSGAQACNSMKSAATADTITTASVSTQGSTSTSTSVVLPMSSPATAAPAESTTTGSVTSGQAE